MIILNHSTSGAPYRGRANNSGGGGSLSGPRQKHKQLVVGWGWDTDVTAPGNSLDMGPLSGPPQVVKWGPSDGRSRQQAELGSGGVLEVVSRRGEAHPLGQVASDGLGCAGFLVVGGPPHPQGIAGEYLRLGARNITAMVKGGWYGRVGEGGLGEGVVRVRHPARFVVLGVLLAASGMHPRGEEKVSHRA